MKFMERTMKYPMTDNREIDIDDRPHEPTDNALVMTHGLPRSGKSTWSRTHVGPIVCPDSIRLAKTGKRWFGPIEHEVWATARTMVRALFLSGHKTVILDSTTGTRSQRDMFLPSPDVPWRRYLKVVPTTRGTCILRALSGPYPELVEVINYMADNWEPVQPEEEIITQWGGNLAKPLDFMKP
jgi:predicted kinase